MQHRRFDNYVRESRNMKHHAQDQVHLDPGRYCNSRQEALDRSPYLRRSLSPRSIDGSRREVVSGHWTETIERREDDWHLRSGRYIDERSRSPSYGKARKRSHFEQPFLPKDHGQLSELQQIRGLPESRNFPSSDQVLDYKHDLRYRHEYDDLNIKKEKEVAKGRWSDGSGQRTAAQESMGIKDGTAIGSRRTCLDMGPMPIYEDYRTFLPSSRNSNVGSLENERLEFQNTVVSDKLGIKESREVEERHMFNPKNDAYPTSTGFYSREFAGSSSGSLTRKCLESYQDGEFFQVSNELSRSGGDLRDPVRFSSYGKSILTDSSIDIGARKLNLTHHQQGSNTLRGEREDYFYPNSDKTVNGSQGYPSGEIQKHTQRDGCIDYNSAVGSVHGDFLRPKVASTDLMKLQHAEDLSADHITGITYKHYSLQKQTDLDYSDMGLTTKALKCDSEYAGTVSSQVEVGKRVFQDYEITHSNPSYYGRIMHERSDYDYGTEAGLDFFKGRLCRSPLVMCDEEDHRNTEGEQTEGFDTHGLSRDQTLKRKYYEEDTNLLDHRIGMLSEYVPSEVVDFYDGDEEQTEGVGTYSLRDQMLKRKYYKKDTNLLDHRIGMLSEYVPSEIVDLYDGEEEWIGRDISGQNSFRESGFDHNKHRKSNRKYDQCDHRISDCLLSRERYLCNPQKHINAPRYMKDNRRHGPLSWSRSQKNDSRNSLRRQPKVWKKTKEDNSFVHLNGDNLSDDSVAATEAEPFENPEDFKQKVHEAFLKYSKKLNMKPAVRKRYKEQGNGGSIYCIICGLSFSKEYKDTRCLVKHAYRSDKVESRAKHLGLGRAICVLMGWNSEIPHDITTWVPEVLPEAEGLVQKEDLIMWPPVIVIRNISLINNNRNNSRVVTIEALESFLRGKGLIKGRVKTCWGRPADKSVLVLRFLSTVSGLADAERLHKYFSERNHGRLGFQRAKCNNGRSRGGERVDFNNGREEGDEMKKKILYGYMGIAEDLDEVDFNTKRLCLIKSKKEILEL